MSNYRRAYLAGGTWFFTVNLLQRHHNDLLIRNIEVLRQTVKQVFINHPFHIVAWVVLPDHIHCIWNLPPDDSDYQRHVDYLDVNPLKHGYVKRVVGWPYSTFHRYVAHGMYPAD